MNATFYFAEPNLLPDQIWSLVSSIQLFLIIPKLFCFFPVSSWASLSLFLSHFLKKSCFCCISSWRSDWKRSTYFVTFSKRDSLWSSIWATTRNVNRFWCRCWPFRSAASKGNLTFGLHIDLLGLQKHGRTFLSISWQQQQHGECWGAFEPCDLFLRSYFLMKRCCHTSVTHFWLELQSRQKNWRFLFLKEGKKHLEL